MMQRPVICINSGSLRPATGFYASPYLVAFVFFLGVTSAVCYVGSL